MLSVVKALAAIANAIPELKGICEKIIVWAKNYRAQKRAAEKTILLNSRIDAVLARLRDKKRK